MQIKKTVEVGHSVGQVWQALCDIELVAACLPGASITEDLGGDKYKGRLQVKVGPLAAAFAGEVAIERRPDERSATVSGKGTDAKSASRASGSLSYRLEAVGATATRIEVDSQVDLAGPLAQFGKSAVMNEIANRITNQFVSNLETRLQPAEVPAEPARAAEPVPSARTEAAPLDAGNLLWSVIRDRVTAFLARVFGRRRAEH